MRMTMYLSSDDADYETHPTVHAKRDDDGDFYIVFTDNDGTELGICMTEDQYMDFCRYINGAKALAKSTKKTTYALALRSQGASS